MFPWNQRFKEHFHFYVADAYPFWRMCPAVRKMDFDWPSSLPDTVHTAPCPHIGYGVFQCVCVWRVCPVLYVVLELGVMVVFSPACPVKQIAGFDSYYLSVAELFTVFCFSL